MLITKIYFLLSGLNPALLINTPNYDNFETYDFNVFVYAVNYNLLRIVGGMAGLAFSN